MLEIDDELDNEVEVKSKKEKKKKSKEERGKDRKVVFFVFLVMILLSLAFWLKAFISGNDVSTKRMTVPDDKGEVYEDDEEEFVIRYKI